MAGHPLGASAPFSPIVTRTRRTFGTVPMQGGELVTVLASRRASDCAAVQLLVGVTDAPAQFVHALIEPQTARTLARALIEAASAVEMAQRRPVFIRQGGAA